METNGIKNNVQTNNTNNLNGNFFNMDGLINQVKEEDARNLRITKSFQWVYIIMIVIYTVMMFFPYPGISFTKHISVAFYIASMIAFALIFRNGYKEYKGIDYTLPVIEMLRKVTFRYQLSTKKFLMLSIPILLMDVGVTLSFYNDLLPLNPINRVLLVQIIYIPVFTISALIGVLVWRKKQKPLHDKALELIEELERE